MIGGASHANLVLEAGDSGHFGSIDPRARLAAALGFLIVLPLVHAPAGLAAALAIGISASVAARLPLRSVVGRLLIAEGFLIALLLTLPFVVPGRPLFTLFWLTASAEGLWRAVSIVVRINAGVLVTMALLAGLGGARLAAAMSGLGVPRQITRLLPMTMRYIALFGEEYTRLRRAMLVRGFQASSSRHTWKMLGNLFGMLLVRSLERAERVRWAMACRGYSGNFLAAPPTRLGPADWVFLALAALAVSIPLLLGVLA